VPNWNDGLTGVALQIASSDDDRLRVLAGPGTGKTFALKRLVMRVLDEGVDPRRILVLTFTRTAAADLSNELTNLGVPGCEHINAGTLHSFCFKMLRSSEALAAHNRYPRPLIAVENRGWLGFELGPLLADLNNADVFGNQKERIKRVRAFEAAWARSQFEEAGSARDPIDQQFDDALISWLVFHRAMLIGELVPEALKYLRANPTARHHTDFDRVIVDEYQDLNKAEQTVLDLLAANGKLMIVGDEDQSIYSFRHANPEGITDFAARHAATVDHTLDECRRCGKTIVAAANNLIAYNHLGSSTPHAMREFAANPVGEIHLVQWMMLADEIRGIAEYVKHLLDEGTYTAGDVLILCPRRRIGYQIRNELLRSTIDAHSYFHEEALEDDEAQEAFTLLTLLTEPDDRVALRFWLGFGGSNNWRRNQYKTLRDQCETSGDSPRETLEKMDNGTIPSRGCGKLLERFRLLKARLDALQGLTGTALVDTLFPKDIQWAIQFRDILTGIEIDDLTDGAELVEFLRTYVTQPEVPTHPDFVRIMSLHASKGLTSKVVVVASVIDSLIPHLNVEQPIAEQRRNELEQRRLFYVAITRPRNVLVLSSPARIDRTEALQMGAKVRNGGRTFPSRFMSQLGTNTPSKSGAAWKAGGYRP